MVRVPPNRESTDLHINAEVNLEVNLTSDRSRCARYDYGSRPVVSILVCLASLQAGGMAPTLHAYGSGDPPGCSAALWVLWARARRASCDLRVDLLRRAFFRRFESLPVTVRCRRLIAAQESTTAIAAQEVAGVQPWQQEHGSSRIAPLFGSCAIFDSGSR